MTVNKRKKVSRMRGSHTHGWGAKCKHRGAGHRGGRGNAGSGKRSDCKKPSNWGDVDYFGKHGFVSKGQREETVPVNLMYFEERLEKLVKEKLIKREGEHYIIDVSKLGFNKVLGYGKIKNKYKITSPYFSKEAKDKIKEAGGEAIETAAQSNE